MTQPQSLWDIDVLTEAGQSQKISELLQEQWTLVLLFRHAECIECSMLVYELQPMYAQLKQWNVQLLAVGNGPYESLARLRERLSLPASVTVCSDPTLQLHQNLELHSGWTRSFGGRAMMSFISAMIEGHFQTKLLAPNMPQQSGLVLLKPQKERCWQHSSTHLGDIPSAGEIMEQILLHRSGGGE